MHQSFPTRKKAEEWLEGMHLLRAPCRQSTEHLPARKTDVLPNSPMIKAAPTPVVPTSSPVKPNASAVANLALSVEQQMVLNTVQSGKSVFFTGSAGKHGRASGCVLSPVLDAGTGKSVLLREIIRTMGGASHQLAVTASTGMAAVNIGGVTLHSWAGIGIGNEDAKKLAGRLSNHPITAARWSKVRTLIIDESGFYV